jgi:hypothetical protein
MASREPITLTSAEVYALAERLRARATSVVLRDATSQQSDGILAAGALVHLVAELRALRGEIERAASSASEMAPLPGYVSNHVHCPRTPIFNVSSSRLAGCNSQLSICFESHY